MRLRRIAHLGLFVAIALSGAPAASVMAAPPLDESPPSGTLDLFPESGLNAYSGYTPISSILARVSTAIDADGLDKLRISNTGAASGGMLTTYEEFAYATTQWDRSFSWELANATGGSRVQAGRQSPPTRSSSTRRIRGCRP